PPPLTKVAIHHLEAIEMAPRIVDAVGAVRNGLAAWKDSPQLAEVDGGYPDRSLIPKLWIDVALPEVWRLHDMHIAVHDLEALLSHRLSSLMPIGRAQATSA